jgi:hypothetical protein
MNVPLHCCPLQVIQQLSELPMGGTFDGIKQMIVDHYDSIFSYQVCFYAGRFVEEERVE